MIRCFDILIGCNSALIRIRLHPDPVQIRIWPDPKSLDPAGSDAPLLWTLFKWTSYANFEWDSTITGPCWSASDLYGLPVGGVGGDFSQTAGDCQFLIKHCWMWWNTHPRTSDTLGSNFTIITLTKSLKRYEGNRYEDN